MGDDRNLEERPSIFAPNNRPFWDALRRFLIWLLKELDKWYGYTTFRSR